MATNIAETSMTIPGVSFVIDSGYKKEKEFIFRASGGESKVCSYRHKTDSMCSHGTLGEEGD